MSRRAAILLAALGAASMAAAAAGSPDVPEILITRQLAEAEAIAVGDVVTLAANAGGTAAREFLVAGIYEPTPNPMRLTAKRHEARLHLPDLIELAGDPDDPGNTEAVSSLRVALRDSADAEAFAAEVATILPGLVAIPNASRQDGSNPFVVLERFHFAIAIVTVLGSTAFLLALMVMRADERRETVGILRLVGFRRSRVLREVFFEGLIIAVTGALVGVVLAVATESLFNRFFQWRYDTALVFVRVTLPIAARCVATAVPLGVLAGIVAAWTVLRRDVLALLRR